MSELSAKRKINILYIDGEKSHLSHARGKSSLQHFKRNWVKLADVNIVSTTPELLSSVDLSTFTVIWLDNVRTGSVVSAIMSVKEQPESDIRVVYALDELIWEGPAGRSTTLNECRVVESLIGLSDTVVVPDPTLVQLIQQMGILAEEDDYIIIPTTVAHDFYPTYNEYRKSDGGATRPLAKVLVKGVFIPENVQRFIERNYKAMNITISSTGELSERITNLINSGDIKHIRHWSNPEINAKNASIAYAMERDRRFDFTIITKPTDLSVEYYELASGDDDVVFAIASGSLPICGIDHVGYHEESSYYGSKLTFGPDTSASELSALVKGVYKSNSQWNKHMSFALESIKERVAGTPTMLKAYYIALVGKDVVEAEAKVAHDVYKQTMELADADAESTEPSDDQSNIIEGKFGEN